jgi:hypothetical protein
MIRYAQIFHCHLQFSSFCSTFQHKSYIQTHLQGASFILENIKNTKHGKLFKWLFLRLQGLRKITDYSSFACMCYVILWLYLHLGMVVRGSYASLYYSLRSEI